MIRFADNSDKEQIISLWQEAFFDSRKHIENFLNYIPISNALVYNINSEIVSMLFLLPCKLVILNNEYRAKYIYAACTKMKYRNNGYMAKLIEAAKETSAASVDFLLLSPASDSLYDFYKRFGFECAFKEKIIALTRKQLTALSKRTYKNQNFCEDISLEQIRNDILEKSDYVKWNNNHISFAMISDQHILNSNGYIIYCEKNQTCIVKEICLIGKSFCELVGTLLEKSDCEKFEFRLPVLYPFTHQEETVKDSGMLFCLNPSLESVCKNVHTAYLGLELD